MERDQIIREDFPTVRKGWSPEAVRAHLNAVAEAAEGEKPSPTPTAAKASGRVEVVIAAAEEAAAEILDDARAEADRVLDDARAEADEIRYRAKTESERTVSAANEEASGRVDQARGAVEGLIAQADKLRAQVGALGRDLASNVPGAGSTAASAGSVRSDASIADPVVVPEVAPEPVRTPDAPKAGKATDEDLIAQLKGGGSSGSTGVEEPEPPAPAESGSDDGAVRLVAMNMALEGAPRERIARRIDAEFGSVPHAEKLIDDVLERAAR